MKFVIKTISIIILLLGAGALSLCAQRETRNAPPPLPENPVVDTIPPASTTKIDTMERKSIEQLMAEQPDTAKEDYKLKKSPWGAVLRTVAIPGWGQLYNEDYWKVPVFLGGAAALYYVIIQNHMDFADFRDRAAQIENKNSIEYRILASQREDYRSRRDVAGLYLLGVYILASIDAYVGANLYDFSVDDDLSFRPQAGPAGSFGVAMSYRFR